jgi:response regulator RpfG family c-di-GMP phosphodiesterase
MRKILYVGESEELLSWLRARLSASYYLGIEVTHPDLIVFNTSAEAKTEESLLSGIREIRGRFPDSPFLLTFGADQKVSFADMIQLGLREFYQTPFEVEALVVAIHEKIPVRADPKAMTVDSLARIGLDDIQSRSSLPFDVYVYLPSIQRVILLRRKGYEVDKELLRKFERFPELPLYVRHEDLGSFRKMQVERLFDANADSNPQERSRRLREESKKIFSSLFTADPKSDSEARALLDTTNEIARQFAAQVLPGRNLKQFLQSFGAQPKSNYSHVVNASAYCVAFGALAGIADLEALSMGALLHDVGLSTLPFGVVTKSECDMTSDELNSYRLHPYQSIDLLTKRGIHLTPDVHSMILQHHELPDGLGYPNASKSTEIHQFAKILALADAFDDLTKISVGVPACSIQKAIETIMGANGLPAMPFFEASFHGPICRALLGQKDIETGTVNNPPMAA